MIGRPTVFTEYVLQKLEEAFAFGCTDEEACLYADISPSSIYNYQHENPEFLERKKLLRQKPILKARMILYSGMEGNPNLALKFLERKKSDEFGLHATASIDIKDERTGFEHPELEATRLECVKIMDAKLKEINLR